MFKHSISYDPAFYDCFGAQRDYSQPWYLKRPLRLCRGHVWHEGFLFWKTSFEKVSLIRRYKLLFWDIPPNFMIFFSQHAALKHVLWVKCNTSRYVSTRLALGSLLCCHQWHTAHWNCYWTDVMMTAVGWLEWYLSSLMPCLFSNVLSQLCSQSTRVCWVLWLVCFCLCVYVQRHSLS